jgi:hypothetical protein
LNKAVEDDAEPSVDIKFSFEYASESASSDETMQQLISWGVISSEMASFVNFNPSAVTLRGTYNSGAAAPPPLQVKLGAQGWKLTSTDADIINQTVVNESSAPFTASVNGEAAEIRLLQSYLGGLACSIIANCWL